MSTVRVKDMTRDDPDSDLAAVVQFPEGQRAVHVLKDGTVRLISPAGTVIARFQEEQKRDTLRQGYIEHLLSAGVTGAELERALDAIARVDKRLVQQADRAARVADLEARSEARFREWCREQGVEPDDLTESEFNELLQQAIRATRRTEQ
jgi:hypothetical protein